MRLEIASDSINELYKWVNPHDAKFPKSDLRGFINLNTQKGQEELATDEIHFGALPLKIKGLTATIKDQIETTLNSLKVNRTCKLELNKTNNSAHIIVPDAPPHQSSLGIMGGA